MQKPETDTHPFLEGVEEFLGNLPALIGYLTGIVTFLGAWIYCMSEYGFLFGFGLGWLPAAILAVIVGAAVRWLWPFIVLAWVVLYSGKFDHLI